MWYVCGILMSIFKTSWPLENFINSQIWHMNVSVLSHVCKLSEKWYFLSLPLESLILKIKKYLKVANYNLSVEILISNNFLLLIVLIKRFPLNCLISGWFFAMWPSKQKLSWVVMAK